jgi:hypothetical protein
MVPWLHVAGISFIANWKDYKGQQKERMFLIVMHWKSIVGAASYDKNHKVKTIWTLQFVFPVYHDHLQNNTSPNSNGSVLSAYCSSVLGPQLPVPRPWCSASSLSTTYSLLFSSNSYGCFASKMSKTS